MMCRSRLVTLFFVFFLILFFAGLALIPYGKMQQTLSYPVTALSVSLQRGMLFDQPVPLRGNQSYCGYLLLTKPLVIDDIDLWGGEKRFDGVGILRWKVDKGHQTLEDRYLYRGRFPVADEGEILKTGIGCMRTAEAGDYRISVEVLQDNPVLNEHVPRFTLQAEPYYDLFDLKLDWLNACGEFGRFLAWFAGSCLAISLVFIMKANEISAGDTTHNT